MAPPKPAPLPESWQEDNDELKDSTVAASSNQRYPFDRPRTSEGPGAPPPTPASPQTVSRASEPVQIDVSLLHPSQQQQQQQSQHQRGLPSNSESERRPEKTTATASRMIAAGLGLKAPKRTEEQRQYDQAVRDQERKAREARREAERRAVQEREQAQRAMWDD